MPDIKFADIEDLDEIISFVSKYRTLDTDEPIDLGKARGQLQGYIEKVSLLVARRNGDILGVLGFENFSETAVRVPFVLLEEKGLILKFRRFILRSFPKLKVISWRNNKRGKERFFNLVKKEE